ncbi:MAG: YbaK/EbsC family protein [Proteocatella sp.]
MAIEKVRKYLKEWGLEDKIMEFETSSATVELAAKAVGCEPERIAKTLSFRTNEDCILIVCAGDTKIENSKFKKKFNTKAKMLSYEDVLESIGHGVGGVCPFGVNENVKIYLDESLKRFETVFPACGSENSAIELNINQLETISKYEEWVDVCKVV